MPAIKPYFFVLLCLLFGLLLNGCDVIEALEEVEIPEPNTTASGQINVQNTSGETILFLYISSCSSSSWGADRLGTNVLPSGQSLSFTVSPGCYDLRAESLYNYAEQHSVSVPSGGTFRWILSPGTSTPLHAAKAGGTLVKQ